MPYDWEDAAKGEGSPSDRLSPGTYQVRCTKVIMEKDGVPYQSRNGDPQFMIVVENERGEEGTVFFTLSEKAAWALARWLSKSGADLRLLKEKGVEPHHFSESRVAEKFLLGKKTMVKVSAGKDPKYPQVEPVDAGTPTSSAPPSEVDDLNLDDIPF